MISAGIEGRLTYMTYPEPWGGPPKQPPEFLRPAPKPLPQPRYNGVTISTSLNGTRLGPPQRPPGKYPSPPAATPVNLTQPKDEVSDELSYPAYSRLFPPPPPFTYHPTGPYATVYPNPYAPLLRPNYAPPPLSPLESPYTPTTPSVTSTATFLSPPANFSPPSSLHQQTAQTVVRVERKPSPSFKVPSGKEGSLKHRILTRPGDVTSIHPRQQTLDFQPSSDGLRLPENTRKRLTATVSPPKSPAKPTNSAGLSSLFGKRCFIQLENGELRKIEDMRTEDFVNCCERSRELRLADSTVVKIEENPILGTGTVTLSYNQRRNQIEYEAPLEHPYFVYGQGWAACSPDKTQQIYGLRTVHRLQVGDIVVSMIPREPNTTPSSTRGATIITTATTTAVTARQLASTGSHQQLGEKRTTVQSHHLVSNTGQRLMKQQQQHMIKPVSSSQHLTAAVNLHHTITSQSQPPLLPPPSLQQSRSPDCFSSKKRRWSAPDQICDEDEQNIKKVKT